MTITCPKWVAAEPGKKKCAHYQQGGDCGLEGGAPDGAPKCIEWRKVNAAPTAAPPPIAAEPPKLDAVARTRSLFAGLDAPRPPSGHEYAETRSAGAYNGATHPDAPQSSAPQQGAQQPSASANGIAAGTAPQATQAMSPERAALLGHRAGAPRLQRVPMAGGGSATVLNPEPFAPAKEIPKDSIEALERYGAEFELAPETGAHVFLVPKLTEKSNERLEITFRDAATLRLLVDSFPGARVVDIVRKKAE